MRALPILYVVGASVSLMGTGCTWNGLFTTKSGRDKGSLATVKHVKTTAYTHSERSHRAYGRANAIGSNLQSGKLTSASADWSRYPLGTRFKIKETGKEYIIDDYGSALVGTDTIDLYKTTLSEMRGWGVRHVDIEIVTWGSFEKSLSILKDRQRNRHVRTMVVSLRQKQAALASGGRAGTTETKESQIRL